MKKVILLLILVLVCSFQARAEVGHAESAPGESTVSPLTALSIVLIFHFTDMENLTRGYISLEPTGVHSVERYFTRDGLELRLLGMAHIARKSFYEDVKNSLNGKTALMLMEGITDDKELLTSPLDYGTLASKIGANNQRDEFSPASMPENIEVIRADVDTADFSTGTIEILNHIGQTYSGEGFTLTNLIAMYLKLSDAENSRNLMKDLITRRNECLLGHLEANLSRHQLILIPWGALHLPDIEKRVVEKGFVLREQKSRAILRFPEYFKLLLPAKTAGERSRTPVKSLTEVLGI